MIDWKPVSSRIIVATFKSNVHNVTVIPCYAPTEDTDIEAKEAFYVQLNTTIHKVQDEEDDQVAPGEDQSKWRSKL
jgi:hypothetical protein